MVNKNNVAADFSPVDRVEALSRRAFLVEGAKASMVLGVIGSFSSTTLDKASARTKDLSVAMEGILKGAKPTKDYLILKLPEIAENGNVVPVTIDGRPLLALNKTVQSLHILATDNPWPQVVSFEFFEHSGAPIVTSRMRLARSQKVLALAAMDDGSYYLSEAFVKVTIGGCGG